ncbi:M16 family metallopeptidase [Sphingomonas sp. ID0503]|uniref:M16 family metallopeptidase n=1 Tax=Sphingomonas sp. ID0503 TaxID=3399691 RepID=UPI003AFB5D82
MIRSLTAALAATLLSTTAIAQAPAPSALPALVKTVDIPYERFTLPNGLKVIVHTDRKAPVVAVSVWYHIGSKNEPAGKTGFAHLFEHLMFNGSENANFDFFKPMEAMGATDLNGTTWFDRTNYFETVPVGGLEQTLWLEADRMGHLLGAIDQAKLDNQRGVVQNEKREGDNKPYGLVEYAQLQALFPEGHPYQHSTIGSMKDLDSASLDDVKGWFQAHYGPNNAVLVLAGDIDARTARPLIEKYFGAFKRGPETPRPAVPVPSLKAPVDQVMHDAVSNTRIYRNWVVPGLNDADTVPLDIGMAVLGGLSSSRLNNLFVRQDKTAVGVAASIQEFENISLAEVTVDVKDGADAKAVAAKLDQVLADYIAKGPTADEVQRAAMKEVAGTIAGLEQVGGFEGKAVTLAEGEVYSNDPEKYRKDLAAYAASTPAQVTAALQKWLTRPAFRLTVVPGERSAQDNAMAGNAATSAPRYYVDPANGGAAAPAASGMTAAVAMPKVAEIKDLEFPTLEHATLANGVKVTFARRTTVPTVRVALVFDGGNSGDVREKLGTGALMRSLLDEGTKTMNSVQLAEAKERLGAEIGVGATMDKTTIALFALKPNLAPSLDLLSDIARNPAFEAGEVERLRGQVLAGIAAEKTDPGTIARRTLPGLLFGQSHPYGVPSTGTGTEEGVKAATRADLVAFHDSWIRPDMMEIVVVGDTTLAEIKPLLDSRFGNWTPPTAPKGKKVFAMDRMARVPRIVLIDRPQSPQSVIRAGVVTPLKGTDDTIALTTANEVLGGSFLSRLNMDLRETKGWAYGAFSLTPLFREAVPFYTSAPVQADKTGESIKAIMADMKEFLTAKGVNEEELDRTVSGQIRSLPGSFETSDALMSAIVTNITLDRPDDYYVTLPARYRALTAPALDKAARDVIRPENMIWVVVGDAAKVRPQLDGLGLPVEMGKSR